mgnify:CR=1 FL=1
MPTRATKIVATLGPASSDPAMLEAMIRAGVNVVRLNFSHGKAQDHIDRARLVREAATRAGREVAIMADLQGPKIRVGKFAEGKVMLEVGHPFVLDALRTEPGDIHGVGLDYKALPREVKAGDVLLLNDGLIVITVDKVVGEQVHTIVTLGGVLSNNKGINKKGGGLTAPALTAKDMEDIKTAMSFQADYLAVSFPKNATDMEMARQLCNVAGAEFNHTPLLIAKIERAEAIPKLLEILLASDGIMVARGDLGVELPYEQVPNAQKDIIALANRMGRPVITATQMLESMIDNPRPTRAEASDVANAILDGTDAVMLSAETAAGSYPRLAVEAMRRIITEIETHPRPGASNHAERRTTSGVNTEEAIAAATVAAVRMLESPLVIVFTKSGFSARIVSSHRPSVPILALTDEPRVCRQLSLVWGVVPRLVPTARGYDHMVAMALREALDLSLVTKGDRVLVTAGVPFDVPGTTNLLKVETV